MKPSVLSQLLRGDLLVFSRKGLFDWIIKIKTYNQATHCEVYIGDGFTVASRNGQGCARYPVDVNGLLCVLRPKLPFNVTKAMDSFWKNHNMRPYGWLVLCEFLLPGHVTLQSKGEFCSELLTNFCREGGLELFNPSIQADKVAPSNLTYIHQSVVKRIYDVNR